MLKIIDNFFNNTELLDELYSYFYHTGSMQFDFFPKKYTWSSKHSSWAEASISQIIRMISIVEPKFRAKGYEPWINVLDRDTDHLNHHVDCDEESEGIRPAKMTAVLFLGSHEGLEGGDLAIDTNEGAINAGFYDSIYDLQKNIDNGWIRIPYKYNRLILLDSNYPHAVLPITNINAGESRITLIVSAWDKKIKVQR